MCMYECNLALTGRTRGAIKFVCRRHAHAQLLRTDGIICVVCGIKKWRHKQRHNHTLEHATELKPFHFGKEVEKDTYEVKLYVC